MERITKALMSRFKYVLMYDDETVLDAVRALRGKRGNDSWYLVVDVGDGRYAAGSFAMLTGHAREQGKDFFHLTLGSLADVLLMPVAAVLDQKQGLGEDTVQRIKYSDSKVAVVVKDGKVRGIFSTVTPPADVSDGADHARESRSRDVPGEPEMESLLRWAGLGGVFESSLLNLASTYYPEFPKATYSRRRQEAMKAARKEQSKKASTRKSSSKPSQQEKTR